MKSKLLAALLAALSIDCGAGPIACQCLEIRVTVGPNDVPLRDAQIWLIDSASGDQQFVPVVIADSLFVGGAACLPTPREYEVRMNGYRSQRFTHAPTSERRCNSGPPFPVVQVHLDAQ